MDKDSVSKTRFDAAYSQTISGLSSFLNTPILPPAGDFNDKSYRIDRQEPAYGPDRQYTALFLADTFWQAVRLYALMHDIGHLPMSHAFEEALAAQKDLFKVHEGHLPERRLKKVAASFADAYEARKAEYSGSSATVDEHKGFTRFFAELFSTDPHDEVQVQRIEKAIDAHVTKSAFHEIRGVSIFSHYIATLEIPFSSAIQDYGRIIHFVALAIFFGEAALAADNPLDGDAVGFLHSIKKIVDGEIDADRLDYTYRDGVESGTDIGPFDLTSIVSNAILTRGENRYFSFGFFHQAVSAIEQFYEQRYQGYKYIIHHRTSSRSNRCLEHLIGLVLNYVFLYPKSKIAALMEDFGYIERSPSRASFTRILPDDYEYVIRVDDASLRTLLFSVRRAVGDEPSENDTVRQRILSEITTLSDVVLLRRFEHVMTIYRTHRLYDVIHRVVSQEHNVPDSRLIDFAHDLVENYEELTRSIRKQFTGFRFGKDPTPVSVVVELVQPKIYSPRKADKKYGNKVVVVRQDGKNANLDDASSALRTMRYRRQAESHVRVYVACHNIKHDNKLGLRNEIYKEFDRFILTQWHSFSKKYKDRAFHSEQDQ